MKKGLLMGGMAILTLSLTVTGCNGKRRPVNEKKEVEAVEEFEENKKDEESKEDEEDKDLKEKDEADEESEEGEEDEDKKTKKTSNANKQSETDLYSFKIGIDGTVYQFPMTYDEFTKLGWEYDDDDTRTLDAHSYTAVERFVRDEDYVYTSFLNLSDKEKPYSECVIGGIEIEKDMLGDSEVTLPGGIIYPKATEEDIIKAYGEPTDRYDGGDGYITLTYSLSSYQEVKFSFTCEGFDEVEIQNFMDPNDVATASGNEEEKLDIVDKYEAPKKLSDSFKDYTVEFAGDLYHLPAPVSEFVDNGFKIVTSESNMQVEAEGYGWVTLMKDNQSMWVVANNYANEETTINNCFVISIEADVNGCNLPCEISKEIAIGMSEKALKKALDGTKYEVDESEDFTYYNLTFRNSDGSYSIVVNKESNKVSAIEIKHEPSAEKLFK